MLLYMPIVYAHKSAMGGCDHVPCKRALKINRVIWCIVVYFEDICLNHFLFCILFISLSFFLFFFFSLSLSSLFFSVFCLVILTFCSFSLFIPFSLFFHTQVGKGEGEREMEREIKLYQNVHQIVLCFKLAMGKHTP